MEHPLATRGLKLNVPRKLRLQLFLASVKGYLGMTTFYLLGLIWWMMEVLVGWLVGCCFLVPVVILRVWGERDVFCGDKLCFFGLLAGFRVGEHVGVTIEAFFDFGSLGHLEEDLLAAAQRSQTHWIRINNGSLEANSSENDTMFFCKTSTSSVQVYFFIETTTW